MGSPPGFARHQAGFPANPVGGEQPAAVGVGFAGGLQNPHQFGQPYLGIGQKLQGFQAGHQGDAVAGKGQGHRIRLDQADSISIRRQVPAGYSQHLRGPVQADDMAPIGRLPQENQRYAAGAGGDIQGHGFGLGIEPVQ